MFTNSEQSKLFLTLDELKKLYGDGAIQLSLSNNEILFVFSQQKDFDFVELEQLLESVGWSRRPLRRVKKALENSLLKIGIWRHDLRFPRLVGFARCTGDGVLEATVWDVAISPIYQRLGLGKELMKYTLKSLRRMGIKKVTLFADPGVVKFYQGQGWDLEPKDKRCAFWYAS